MVNWFKKILRGLTKSGVRMCPPAPCFPTFLPVVRWQKTKSAAQVFPNFWATASAHLQIDSCWVIGQIQKQCICPVVKLVCAAVSLFACYLGHSADRLLHLRASQLFSLQCCCLRAELRCKHFQKSNMFKIIWWVKGMTHSNTYVRLKIVKG